MSLKDKKDNAVRVTNNESLARYEIFYEDQDKPAGYADYITRTSDAGNDERLFIHTEISEDFGGRGLASILIAEALKDTLPSGLTVVGVCPFVKGYVEKHGYAGTYRNPQPADITWLDQRVIESKGLNT